ncbi:ABC transporter ATP-binding protein [Thermosulfurimonas sp. F29]|uniref:ABC transporter ATP-binding protein n=1 Tax=Thermosulfurimonas sp. F29 TaxID=2867247 RepID=UPI001C8370FC|nr:ABC transporter ATP-binding protein [Thermosulfurimonas sp. F29]MBX6423498.1 energy-coupling factor ABC transporter ATP-binding protein [Thermosulfurimonas sp. F29]
MIRVNNLSYRYPGGCREALSRVSLKVYPGELLLLSGETGSGKSTLLSVLCGLIPSQAGGEFSGEVEVLGRKAPFSPADIFPEVAVVLQNPAEGLVADTVFSEVAFGLENLGYPEREIVLRVEEALSAVGLGGFEDRKLSELSGGERQRAALAAALALRPKLLLLDEPLAQLDHKAARRIMTLLRKLSRRGITVVLAEHRLNLAITEVDRIIHLSGGRKVYDGRPQNFTPPERSLPRPRPSRSGEVRLELRNLSFAYPGRPPIFSGVNLAFRTGERIALLGENGSGKSTFLHLLGGLLKPSGGEIRWHLPDSRDSLRVGLLLQDPDLMLVHERVASELEFTPQNLGLPKMQREIRIREVARKLDLEGHLGRNPLALSRGERLRVALGAILTGKPRVLLLDEPTTAQDPRHLSGLLSALSADLLFFSTHEEDIARALASRILRFPLSSGVKRTA